MTMITDNPALHAMRNLGAALPRPSAILCISAHWETRGKCHLTAQDYPPTIHDFRGFPQALFDMRYPAPGSTGLMDRVTDLLSEARILRDESWGFDHGTWGVLKPMFPDATIPTLEMSLDRTATAEDHLALGRALAPLRDEDVLIVGSGNVVHNLALWRQSAGTRPEWAVEFQNRINAAVIANDTAALTSFTAQDQAAAWAINSGEHYLPLLYAVGARQPGDEVAVFSDTIDGALSMTSYLIGDAALANGIGQ